MIPVELTFSTRVRKAKEPGQRNLTIVDRCVGGRHQMVTLWKPTADELAQLQAGGFVQLTVEGSEFPEVEVGTQAAKGTHNG